MPSRNGCCRRVGMEVGVGFVLFGRGMLEASVEQPYSTLDIPVPGSE